MENVHVDGQLQAPYADIRRLGIPHVGLSGTRIIEDVC